MFPWDNYHIWPSLVLLKPLPVSVGTTQGHLSGSPYIRVYLSLCLFLKWTQHGNTLILSISVDSVSPQQTHNILRLKKIFLFLPVIIIATQSQNNPLFKRVEYNKLIPNNGFKANSYTFYQLISVRLLHLQELHCVSSGRIFKNFYLLFLEESSRKKVSICYL